MPQMTATRAAELSLMLAQANMKDLSSMANTPEIFVRQTSLCIAAQLGIEEIEAEAFVKKISEVPFPVLCKSMATEIITGGIP